jgi:hypothetical protein
MVGRNGFVELEAPTEGLRAAPIVSETYWGYVIRPSEPALERAAMVEMAATFSGILVLLSAYGQWLLPGADLSPSVMPLKMVSTVIFALLGATLVWIGRVGMVQELHVDRGRHELRLVQRNRHGHGRLVGQIPFARVTMALIREPRLPMTQARLSLRLENGDQVDLVPSAAAELLPIRDRLLADLAPRFRSPEPLAAARPARNPRAAA